MDSAMIWNPPLESRQRIEILSPEAAVPCFLSLRRGADVQHNSTGAPAASPQGTAAPSSSAAYATFVPSTGVWALHGAESKGILGTPPLCTAECQQQGDLPEIIKRGFPGVLRCSLSPPLLERLLPSACPRGGRTRRRMLVVTRCWRRRSRMAVAEGHPGQRHRNELRQPGPQHRVTSSPETAPPRWCPPDPPRSPGGSAPQAGHPEHHHRHADGGSAALSIEPGRSTLGEQATVDFSVQQHLGERFYPEGSADRLGPRSGPRADTWRPAPCF